MCSKKVNDLRFPTSDYIKNILTVISSLLKICVTVNENQKICMKYLNVKTVKWMNHLFLFAKKRILSPLFA